MLLLGLLLMLGCVALAVDAVIQNTVTMHAVAFNQPITDLSLGALFIAGAVVGLLFALGLAMFTGGIGRAGRRRRERRLAEQNSAEADSLRAQNARLEEQLAAERDGDATAYPAEPTTARTGGRHRSPA
jgi:predicted phage tail protein